MAETPPTPPAGERPVSTSSKPPTAAPNGNSGFLGDLFQTRYREVTVSAIVLAILIGVVMNAAITYAGLKIGFTIGGSAIAAVLGFGVLRGIFRKGSILETNIVQTIASAVNTSNSGVIFTVPVLLLMGFTLSWKQADFWLITLACIAGGTLGTAFIIPLRKQMIDIERLRFPSAVGVATILKSPGAGPVKALVLVVGMAIGALIYLPTSLPNIRLEASVAELDGLFEAGKITHADRVRTLEIDRWIEGRDVPDELLQRGRMLREAEEARRAAARDEEDAIARATVAQLEAQLEAAGPIDNVPDKLLLAAARAAAGERSWESLRSRKLGWASRPLFGYADLGWTVSAVPEPDAPPRDLDGDGVPDTVLTYGSDHDQDGRADHILSGETINVGRIFGIPSEFALVFAVAPFALGAGFITGRPGLFVLAGGVIAYFIVAPIAFGQGWLPGPTAPHEASDVTRIQITRPMGIGMLLGGAMMGVLAALPAIREALKSIVAARTAGAGGGDELGLRPLAVAVAGALILLFVAADYIGSEPTNTVDPISGATIERVAATDTHDGYTIAFASEQTAQAWAGLSDADKSARLAAEPLLAKPGWLSGLNPHVRAAIIAIVGAAWIWFAGIIIAQCTGMTDWSPISGLALVTVVLIMLLAGTGAVLGAVLIGAALCVAITLAADMMGDLKTGYLVGAQPKRQQVTELAVVAIGPVVCMFTVLLIAQANLAAGGPAMGEGAPLNTTAPQAQALQAVIGGMQGGQMPYATYGLGVMLGALLGLGSFSGLGVLVGLSMYLPFFYIATYGVGCIVNMIVTKIKGRTWSEDWGVPFAAGLIVGESILALILNFIVLIRG